MPSREPRVFTIPPGAPFLPTLADALTRGRMLEGLEHDPAALAEATIYLPTRRAARAFATLLASQGEGRAQLLPRIVPLGEADDAEFELAGSASEDALFEGPEALAPPIAPLERRLILTGLIQRWAAEVDRDILRLGPGIPFLVPSSPADAVNLAASLERLMDAFTSEDVPWDDLAQAVEADYSKYFEITLRFVRIAAENWPKILAERQASDPALRRSTLIHAEARRLLYDRPPGPVIAAGSTGSMPATARRTRWPRRRARGRAPPPTRGAGGTAGPGHAMAAGTARPLATRAAARAAHGAPNGPGPGRGQASANR